MDQQEDRKFKNFSKNYNEILESIRRKKNLIESQNVALCNFNSRISLLMSCFDAYSYEDLNFKESTSKNDLQSKKQEEKSNHKETLNSNTKKIKIDISNEQKIENLFKSGVERNLAFDIYNLIDKKERIGFEDLMKGIRQSKYKVIEALNVLIKEKIIIKTYDKGFIYKINA